MRNYCVVCGEKLPDNSILTFDNMPVGAQVMPMEELLLDDFGVNLKLCQCKGCGLVQFNCEPVEYYKDSTRAGERSQVLIELRRKQYTHLFELLGRNENIRLLEIGAGRGGFLKTLKEMYGNKVQEFGIENSPELVEFARNNENVNVIKGFIGKPDQKIKGAPFDVFTSFAYLSRLTDPNTVLKCIYNNITDDAIGLIMVPSLEHLFNPGGIYDICNDHLAYYDKKTLRFLLEKNGFEVIEEGEEVDTYIYAYVRKNRKRDFNELNEYIRGFNDEILKYVRKSSEESGKVAVWSAGHYSFTLICLAQLEDYIECIIDNAPFKQGRFSPATHIPIVSKDILTKDDSIGTVLILAPLYTKEIVDDIQSTVNRKIKIAWVKEGKLHEIFT